MIAAGFIGMGVHAAKGSGALNYGLDFVGGYFNDSRLWQGLHD